MSRSSSFDALPEYNSQPHTCNTVNVTSNGQCARCPNSEAVSRRGGGVLVGRPNRTESKIWQLFPHSWYESHIPLHMYLVNRHGVSLGAQISQALLVRTGPILALSARNRPCLMPCPFETLERGPSRARRLGPGRLVRRAAMSLYCHQ